MSAPRRAGWWGRPGWLALAMLCVVAGQAFAQSGRFLGREEIVLYGLGLKVEPAVQTVPRDIATIVSTYLQAPTLPGQLPPFAPDAVVRATLRGPSFPAPIELSVSPNTPFNIPPLTVAGTHTLENIRLVSNGEVLLRATPESVRIEAIDKLLVTQVTARPLTAAEIREKGIVFDKSNFQAYNFTAAFAIEEHPVQLEFPIVLPTLAGASDVKAPTAGVPAIDVPQLRDISTIIPDTLKIQTKIPNLSVVGFTLKVPEIKGKNFYVPPIPGVIVIPGDIGFLNQYFSVMLMVSNVAPAGSGLVVSDLSAEILLPAGNDTVSGSADDPLRMAMTAHGESPRINVIAQPGPDGRLGTADDIVSVGPGETGNAEYLVEGRREGSHVVEMAITGTLNGLPVGPVQITGRAAGAVLVRNPRFTLTFTHPEIVSAGEEYTLDVTVTNTGASPANYVSVNLYGPNISGAQIVPCAPDQDAGTCGPSREVETILPGDSATVSFNLISLRSGKVTATTLDSDENVQGRFALKTAVGELGIPLSPDSLVLPKEASSLPRSLRDAAIGMLGKAWAVATAPNGALPKDVTRFSKKIVLDRAVEVAEAGFRVSLQEPLPASAAQLAMDFAGSNFARLSERFPKPEDTEFERANSVGFDELRRRSVRGDVLADAVAALLAPSLSSSGAAAFHRDLATRWSYRPAHISVLAAAATGALPVRLVLVDGQGHEVGTIGDKGKIVKSIPFSDYLVFKNGQGDTTGQMALLAAPDQGDYTLRVEPFAGAAADATYTLSVVVPDAGGDLRQMVFGPLTLDQRPSFVFSTSDPYRLAFEFREGGAPVPGPAVAPASSSVVADPPPALLGAVQQPDADAITCDNIVIARPGRVIAVLFSEEISPAEAQDRLAPDAITKYLPEANKVVGVALQPGRRIAFLALRDPIGPFVARQLAVAGIADRRGQAMAEQAVPITATIREEGGVVSGQVLRPDGTPLAYANVRLLYEYECGEMKCVAGISSKTAGADGRYDWDFVLRSMTSKVVAVDNDTQEFRDVRFNVARHGQRLNVNVVFLGRGTLAGRTLSEDGRVLEQTVVRVTSLTDRSQYADTTGPDGRFTIPRVPVGPVLIEAVNLPASSRVFVSEFLGIAGGTVTRDLTLLRVDTTGVVVKTGRITGHVLRADGASAASTLPVVAYYQNRSQAGVKCPTPPESDEEPKECATGATTTDAAGAFVFDAITAGDYRLSTFDQAALQEGNARVVLPPNGAVDANVLLSGGIGTVRGVVLDQAGQPVPDARVGGGFSVTTVNAAGEFVLPDVPIGRREIVAVSDALGARGVATVDLLRSGDEVHATIILASTASVAGTVYRFDRATPVAGVKVYLLQEIFGEGGKSVVISGEATTDALGRYRIDRQNLGQYSVSAFLPDFSDGNVVPVVLSYHQQVVRADVFFRGGGGRVAGHVFDDDGATPLKAAVSVSGDRLVIADGKVGVKFQWVDNYQVDDNDFTTGAYSFGNIWVGKFTVRTAGQFSPDPLTFEGEIPAPGATVTMDLKLQPTSQIAGVVLMPDGVTPAPANVIVKFKSNAVKTFCSENAYGEETCTSIPQGIQEEIVVTDDRGRYWLPIVNPGSFTLTIDDPASGRSAEARGSVRAGERAEMNVRLRGLGEITVRVLSSNGTTPIPGARVTVTQIDYPKKEMRDLVADGQGTVVLAGGDAFSEGEFVVAAIDMRNGEVGRASGRVATDGQRVEARVYLYDQKGAVFGTVFKADGVTPVPNAEVIISNAAGPLAFAVTGADGTYRQPDIPRGKFSLDSFEAATGARGAASGEIFIDGQEVPLNITQNGSSVVKGTLMQAGTLQPLKGWTIAFQQTTPTGRVLQPLMTMTGLDGRFSFPGTSVGPFTLVATPPVGSTGQGQAAGIVARAGQAVDVPILVSQVKQAFGRVEGRVYDAGGTPAGNAAVRVYGPREAQITADADGRFFLADAPLGRYVVTAKSQITSNSGTGYGELSFDGEATNIVVTLVGLSRIDGQVRRGDGSPAANVQVTLSGSPSVSCEDGCTVWADENGRFSFPDAAVHSFTVTARDQLHSLSGSVGDVINPGETKSVVVVLQPSGTLRGRVVTAAGAPASAVVAEIDGNNVRLFTETAADGAFQFEGVPLGAYGLSLQDPIGPGLARRADIAVNGVVDLGTLVLDEAPPAVAETLPVAASISVPRDQSVRVTFSEQIARGSVNAANVSLVGPDGPVTATLQVGALDAGRPDRVVTLTPLALLKDEARYSIAVRDVEDLLGRKMSSPFTASFTTVDITPPSAVDVSPAVNGSGVPIYTPIRIKFSEPIDVARFAGPPIAVSAATAAIEGRIDYLYGNTVMVFTPLRPLTNDTVYRVQLQPARDLSGNAQAPALDYTFSTTDGTPPAIAALTDDHGGTVIENAVARVTADVGTQYDVLYVDFYLNDAPAGTVRTVPFRFSFQATPLLGRPGDRIKVAAIPTDTSGNRGPAAVTYVTVTADAPPAVTITAPADGLEARNGDRVTVAVRATDDLGVAQLGYKAGTGKPQDAGLVPVTPLATDRSHTFAFYVPNDAVPGSLISITASAVDSKGTSANATPVSIRVLDAVAPSVAITGASTGDRVRPGQQTSAVVTAQDLGRIRSITFTASGVANSSETRTIDPAQNAVVTTFAFAVASTARPGDVVNLDATATDVAGNTTSAARVILPVADTNGPTVRLRTPSGALTIVPGRAATVIAEAEDESGVSRVDLAGSGAMTFGMSNAVAPPVGSASSTFTIEVPENVAEGAVLRVRAVATDIYGNAGLPAVLALTVATQAGVTLPPSAVVNAGEDAAVAVSVSPAAPAGGLRLTFASSNTDVAVVTPLLDLAEGQSSGTITLSGVAGGTAAITAYIQGVARTSMTVAVDGGFVTGQVLDSRLVPVAGAQVTVSGGGVNATTVSGADGSYAVRGIPGRQVAVLAREASTGYRGFASAVMAHDYGYVHGVNVVLIEAGAVRGTVSQPDGTTAAGAGVQVDIFDAANTWQRLDRTFTDAAGAYEFPLVTLGQYVLIATDTQGNAGRASVSVTTSGQEASVPIVYLGFGAVTGTVRDAGGTPIARAPITFWASSIFGGNSINRAAEDDGTFRFDHVLIGSFTVTASNPGTSQAGSASGSITRHGDTIARDITMAPYGIVTGTVYRSDGTTAVPNAAVWLDSRSATAGTDGRFSFDLVPLGTHVLTASEAATHSQARTSVTLSAAGAAVDATLRFFAQGRLLVTVTDAGGTPVAGAAVSVDARTVVVSDHLYGTTGSDGRVLIEQVLAGDFRVAASRGGQSGEASGRLSADELKSVTVALQPTGSIAGIAYLGDGQTPAAGARVVLDGWTTALTAADGTFRFDGVFLGWHSLEAFDETGRVRARANDIQLAANGEVATRALVFVGLGRITGRVLNPDGSAAQDLTVVGWSQHPTFGGQFSGRTNAGGFYDITGVPAAPFSLSVSEPARQLLGEGHGTLTADGQQVTVDIVLQGNAVTFPQTRYDANNMPLSVQQSGASTGGMGGIFDSGPAFLLDVIAGGTPTRVEGTTIGTAEQGGREVVSHQENVAGLSVTRKTYVPRDGYFARHLEILTNPTADDITVDVRLTSQINASWWDWSCWCNRPAPVTIATSSGDSVFSVADAASADRWLAIDKGSEPGLAFLFDGASGTRAATQAGFQVGSVPYVLTWQWGTVTVPANGQVGLVHFSVQQVTGAAAQAAAERLAQLPPEALVGLSPDEIAAVSNFAIPADGTSALPALPALTGTVTGRLFESDGLTPVAGADVRLTSANVLFGRTYTARTDSSGVFRFVGVLNDSGSSVAVPVDAFSLTAAHPLTGVVTAAEAGTFATGETTAVRDVLFAATGTVAGNVLRPNGSAVLAGTVTISRQSPAFSVTVAIGADGHFRIPVIPDGTYTLTASVPNALGTGLTGTGSVTVVAGVVATADVTIEPTGLVGGTVSTGGGRPAADVVVRLARAGFSRQTRTGTSGRYDFPDVPLGAFTVTAVESTTGIESSASVTVAADTTATQDLALVAIGSVAGRVTESGSPVADVSVLVASTAPGFGSRTATTGGDGTYRLDGVPAGAFTVTVRDDTRHLFAEGAGAIESEGQVVTVDLALVSNTINLPYTQRDANNLQWDVYPDGTVQWGTNAFYGYYYGSSHGAPLLDVVVGENTTRFTGGDVATREDHDREIAVQQTIGGVEVTRKIFVPTNGYFARYLEILRNPTATPITLDLGAVSNVGYRDYYSGYTPSLIQTSSGDATLAVGAPDTADRWAILDDSSDTDPFITGNMPAIAFVFDGPGAGRQLNSAAFSTTNSVGQVSYRWNGITVPANGTVALMHFVVQELSRAAAQAAAERLVALPPEALEGLSAEEIAAVSNFAIPADGRSTLPSLPSLTGVVQVRTLASDGSTPARNVGFTFQSSHPLFGRTYSFTSDDTGRYAVRSRFDNSNVIAVPMAPFTIRATNTTTNVTASASGNFGGLFSGNLSLMASARASSEYASYYGAALAADGSLSTAWLTTWGDSYAAGGSPYIELAFDRDVTVAQVNLRGYRGYERQNDIRRANIQLFNAAGQVLAAQEADLRTVKDVDVDVPDTAGVRRVRITDLEDYDWYVGFSEVEVVGNATSAPISTADVLFSNSGIVRGTVRRHDGALVTSGSVVLSRQSPALSVSANIAADGTYVFTCIPSGAFTVAASVPMNQGNPLTGSVPATVVTGQTTTADITIVATGTVTGRLLTSTGAPAYAAVYVGARGTTSGIRYTYPDGSGAFTFTDIPIGDYDVWASEPRTATRTAVPVSVSADATSSVSIVLVPVGSVRVQVSYPRGGGVPSSYVELFRPGSTSSFASASADASGVATMTNIAAGDMIVRARHPSNSELSSQVPASLSVEGQVVSVTVTLPASGAVAGTVTKADGSACASCRVFVQDVARNQTLNNQYTDATGAYRLEGIPSSTVVRVSAYNPDLYTSNLLRTSGDLTVGTDGEVLTWNTVLHAIASVQVTVTRAGNPLSGAYIYARDVARTYFSQRCHTNSAGQCSVSQVPEGNVDIRVMSGSYGYALAETTAVVGRADHGQVIGVALTADQVTGVGVTGHVYAADGTTPLQALVSVLNAIDRNQFNSTYSSSSTGAYSMSGFTVGSQGVIVRAQSNLDSRVAVEATAVFAASNEVKTVDLVLPVVGVSIRGRVMAADGTTGVSGGRVDVLQNGTVLASYSSVVGADGSYTLPNLWVSPGDVVVRAYSPSAAIQSEQTVTAVTQGQAVSADFVLPVTAGYVSGRVTAADGSTPLRSVQVALTERSGKAIATRNVGTDGSFDFGQVFAGADGFSMRTTYTGSVDNGVAVDNALQFSASGQRLVLPVSLPLSAISGRVTMADGSGVRYPNIFSLGVDGRTRWAEYNSSTGDYSIVGTPAGAFSLVAQASSGLTAYAAGEIEDLRNLHAINIQMPATGAITGVLRSAAGAPLRGYVYAYGTNLYTSYQDVYSDSSGRFSLTSLPAGPVMLQASYYVTDHYEYGSVAATVTAGTTSSVDLAMLQPVTVTGTVYAADGTTPIPGAYVVILATGGAGPAGSFQTSTTADAAGRFTFANVPTGPVYLTANDQNDSASAAFESGTAQGSTSTIDVRVGPGSVDFGRPLNLDGADGFRYVIDAAGRLVGGGTIAGVQANAWSYSHQPNVNDDSFATWTSVGRRDLAGRQLIVGPALTGSMEVTRKIFVPSSGGFVRFLDIVKNPTPVPQVLQARVTASLASSSGTHFVVTPLATRNTYAVTDASRLTDFSQYPALAHVFAGGGALPAPAAVEWAEANSTIRYTWSTTIAAGATAAFLHFELQRDRADAAGASAQAEALMNLTDARALEGLTDAERTQILNFNLAATSGSLAGTVLAADGTTPVAGAKVEVLNATGGSRSAWTTTDAAGHYAFATVFVDAAGFIVRVTGGGGVAAAERALSFSQRGQALTADFTLSMRMGTVQGAVSRADGGALAGASVELAARAGGAAFASTTSSADGSFAFASRWLSTDAFYVRATVPGLSASQESAVALGGSSTVTVPITLGIAQVTISGIVRAGDQATALSGVRVDLLDGANVLSSTTTGANGGFTFASVLVPTAGVNLKAVYSVSPSTAETTRGVVPPVSGTVAADMVLPLSVLSGQVTWGNGTPVSSGLQVFTIGSDGATRFSSGYDTLGHYMILGTPVGAYTITAQETSSGLTTNVTGEIVSAASGTTVDLALPPSGSVTGRVVTAGGSPVSGATVLLLSAGLQYQLSRTTASDGTFTFAVVPTGVVALRARYASGIVYIGGASRVLTMDGLSVDIAPAPTGTVTGTVYAADGVSPLANTSLHVHSLVADAGLVDRSGTTDGYGVYTITGVPASEVELHVDGTSAARASGVLDVGGILTLNAVAGSATRFSSSAFLSGTDTFRYDVQSSGSLSDGGTVDGRRSDAYDGAYYVSVGGTSFGGSNSSAGWQVNGRALVLGPEELGVLTVRRKIYVPASGGYARYLEILRNPLSVPVRTTVRVSSNLGSDSSTHIAVAPSATGNTYAVTTENGGSDPALGHVFAGSAGAPVRPAAVFAENSDSPRYDWTVTVPAGGTAIVMHFAVQREPTDAAGVQAQAQALAALSDANELAELTPEERSQVVNFVVGTGSAALGGAQGVVAVEDGVALIVLDRQQQAEASGVWPLQAQGSNR